jgi:hypothetical protein
MKALIVQGIFFNLSIGAWIIDQSTVTVE